MRHTLSFNTVYFKVPLLCEKIQNTVFCSKFVNQNLIQILL